MATLRQLVARLHAFFRGHDLDRDFAEEVSAHLEMANDENIRRGMPPDEARRQAALRLGGATSLQSQHREARGFRFLDELVQLCGLALHVRLEAWEALRHGAIARRFLRCISLL